MKVVIAKVDEIYFDGEARSLSAPGVEGMLTVMPHHMPFVTVLRPGSITVRADELPEGKRSIDIGGGVLEVHSDGVTVIL
jgi:F-type H+-transporting ATPase subunit epsilon